MTSEEIDTIRRTLDAWNQADFAAYAALATADFELDLSERVLNPDVYRGMQGLERMLEEITEIWEEFSMEVEEIVEAGEGVFVVGAMGRGRGKGSGVPVEGRVSFVWRFRDGKTCHVRLFQDHREALQSVGLGEH